MEEDMKANTNNTATKKGRKQTSQSRKQTGKRKQPTKLYENACTVKVSKKNVKNLAGKKARMPARK